jgi:rhamnosyltransferase
MDISGASGDDGRQWVVAVVVTYHPDDGVWERLDRILGQVSWMVIVDNASGAEFQGKLEDYRRREGRVGLVLNSENLGIATAMNQGAAHPMAAGATWVLTMDQDSTIEPGMVAQLLGMVERQPEPARVGLIGPNFVDANGNSQMKSEGGEDGCIEVERVITSGSLVRQKVWRELAGFRDSMFIDSVDHEFCLRVRRAGYAVLLSRRVLMWHQMGSPGQVKLLGKMRSIPNYPPIRRYYRARNRVMMFKWYLFQEPRFVCRELLNIFGDGFFIVFYEKDKLSKAFAVVRGIWHGLIGRMGRLK